MTDREFLAWIHERLEHVHHENPHMDYMHALRAIVLDKIGRASCRERV